MPGLAVALTLNSVGQSSASSETSAANDLVSFIIGLLLGNNIEVKNWFSHFIKCGQRVIETILKHHNINSKLKSSC